MTKTKVCTKCGKEKSLAEFWKHNQMPDGRRPDCKACYGKPAHRRTLTERFNQKVNKDGPNGCWVWTAGTNGEGYGRIKHNGKKHGAHRVSYELNVGPIGDNFVCHHCDNPSCVNPEHLFLGSNQDNMQDMSTKGRTNPRRGTDNNKAKLNRQQVVEIRKLYSTGKYSQYKLAYLFNVGQPCIKDVVNRITWDWVK